MARGNTLFCLSLKIADHLNSRQNMEGSVEESPGSSFETIWVETVPKGILAQEDPELV